MQIYDTSALYNQNMSLEQQQKFITFYQKVFSKYNINTIHDCSIGAGGTTLPLAKLGYQVSGSDISENLLNKAKENFKSEGYDVELFYADFRDLDKSLPSSYDCIISTGNSLPHICNKDVHKFIDGASKKLNKNGYLYIDIRNWDKLINNKPVFKAFDPKIMTAEQHTSLYQIFNWHGDKSVDFVFVTSTDKFGKHEKASIVHAPTYYPLRLSDYQKMLNDNGFKILHCFDVDDLWHYSTDNNKKTGDFDSDFEYINWYGILAQSVM